MKLTVKQAEFGRGLHVAGRAVATRTPLPITTNVLMTSEDGRLKIAATNLEIAISTWVDAENIEEGSITLPARLLTEFVDTLPDQQIDVTVKEGSQTAHLSSGRFEATIRGMDANDFPAIPQPEEQPAATVDAALLREMIEQVAFAAAADDTRPILTGVLTTFSGNELTLTATDGFRLAVRTAQLPEAASGDFSVIIPARTMSELAKILPEDEAEVGITVTPNRNQVMFRTADLHVVSRLLEGTFPNYKQIIPSKFATKVVVNTGDLLKATKIASFFSRDNANAMTLEIQPASEGSNGCMVVRGAAAELGEDRGELDATIDGEEARLSVNSRYVSDVLGVVPSSQVGLEITGPNSAAVFRPVDSVEYTHVVMPMHMGGTQ